MKEKLEKWGWNKSIEALFLSWNIEGCTVGRIVSEHRDAYQIQTENGEGLFRISGRLRHHAVTRRDLPAVGDWVALKEDETGTNGVIQGILPRISCLCRTQSDPVPEEQVIGTNVDTVFILMSLNRDFNLRRLERYLALVWEGGSAPVVVLTKADLCWERDTLVAEVHRVAAGIPVHSISAITGEGVAELADYLQPGKTIALLGSSGVGKSTLTNCLAGREMLATGEIREKDDRGKHTTTHREMVLLPCGTILMDTPGMRSVGVSSSDEVLQDVFSDVEEYSRQCRFRNCTHQEEPGCQIRAALESGQLEKKRYESFLKLQKEQAYLQRKEDPLQMQAEKQKWKKIHQQLRGLNKK